MDEIRARVLQWIDERKIRPQRAPEDIQCPCGKANNIEEPPNIAVDNLGLSSIHFYHEEVLAGYEIEDGIAGEITYPVYVPLTHTYVRGDAQWDEAVEGLYSSPRLPMPWNVMRSVAEEAEHRVLAIIYNYLEELDDAQS